jgi:hypothetical protein
MTTPSRPDLTRWNRAGLSRFDYLDGNAAVFLERLRAGLQQRFPAWTQAQASFPQDAQGRSLESEEARKQRLEQLYASDPDDMLWQLTRQFARACHVLGGHFDAYANEATLGTASQWENLRRLVELLDYAPLPPASAATPLVLTLKAGKSGLIEAGLQAKYSPAKGAPRVFESLADLEADARLNTLYARDHLNNPDQLTGQLSLDLIGRLDKLKAGEPLVLEDTSTTPGKLSAHRVEGLLLGDEQTTLTLSPAIPAGFHKGTTRVHLLPKERLKPLGPATDGVDSVGHSLQLAGSSTDLAAGDVVLIRSANDKPYYRRLKAVHDDRLVFYRSVGQLTLNGATVARPVTVPISHLNNPPGSRLIGDMEVDSDTVVEVVYVAGDWSRLANEWLADIRKIKTGEALREYLPCYYCLHAKYVPVTSDFKCDEPDERAGYTALTLTWHPDEDDVAEQLDLRLHNPQTLLAPPPTPGPWRVDSFLNKSEGGHLTGDLLCAAGKQTAAGDLAVVLRGSQMAWARLASVALDAEHSEVTLTAQGVWQDRGGGPFFLASSRVYSHFSLQARVADWQLNSHGLSGLRIDLDPIEGGWPAFIKGGRSLIVDNGSAVLETRLSKFGHDSQGDWLELTDPLPAGSTHSNLSIHANVVRAGHGESRPQRVLGSGDGTASNQSFTLAASDLSFVADAGMSAGVRADLNLSVAGETWTQVASLKDSGPSDAHYQVRIDEDGHARIQFGDGRHGRRLPSGGNNVRVSFRQGSGAAGNSEPGLLNKLAKPHPLIEALAQPLPSGGGADREGHADLRVNAPATLLTLDRAVSLSDFAQLARSHASVWQAGAFRLPPGLGQRERIEVVVVVAGSGPLLPALQAELEAFLLARAQPGVNVSVLDHTPLTFQLEVSVRIRTAAFDGQSVAEAVLAALNGAFSAQTRQLGQPLYRGEVYRVVDGVAGVENSQCSLRFDASTQTIPSSEKPPLEVSVDGELQAIKPGPRQCLSFDASGFVVTVQDYEETLL